MVYYGSARQTYDKLQDFGSPVAMLRCYGVKRSNPTAQKLLGQYVVGLLTVSDLALALTLLREEEEHGD